MNKKKILLLVTIITSITVVLFIAYVIKYQQLVNEGTLISNEQCTKVNPLITQKKKLYSDSLEVTEASGSAEEYWDVTTKYLNVADKYVRAQTEWLAKEKEYMERQDFKLLVPSYIQRIAELQYVSRQADVNAQKTLSLMFAAYQINPKMNFDEDAKQAVIEGQKRDNANLELERIWKEHEGKFDIRTFFITVPPSECINQENVFFEKNNLG